MGNDGNHARVALSRSAVAPEEHGADDGSVIPTLILIGFVLGRWWKVVIPATAVAWPVILVTGGNRVDLELALGAGMLAAISTAVGAGVFLAVMAISGVMARAVLRWLAPHG